MQLYRFDNIQEFWHNAQEYLLQHQAEHNLLLGILHTLLHYPERYLAAPYLAFVKGKSNILAIAIRTPPRKLILSKAENLNALALFAQDLQDNQELTGVSGLTAEVETFLQAWQTLTGKSYQQTRAMRIHQLTQVEEVAKARGCLRPATDADRSLLLDWFTAFVSEVGADSQDIEQSVNTGLKRQSIYLWEDSIPVSLVGGSQSLPVAARIGPVYTPPAARRQGYATACVAVLSQKLLNQGCQSCFLFTDVANPTSNHIYRMIGYRPICNWHKYSFSE